MPNEFNDQEDLEFLKFLKLLTTILDNKFGLHSSAIHLLPMGSETHAHVFIYPREEHSSGFDDLNQAEIFLNKIISNFYFNDVSKHISEYGYSVGNYNITPVKRNHIRAGLNSGVVAFRHDLGTLGGEFQTYISVYPNKTVAKSAYNSLSEPFESIWDFLFVPESKLIKSLLIKETDQILEAHTKYEKKTKKPSFFSKLKARVKRLRKNKPINPAIDTTTKDKVTRPTDKFKSINGLLAVLLITISLYIIAEPFIPEAEFFFNKVVNAEEYNPDTVDNISDDPFDEQNLKSYDENTLVISSIGVEGKVYEGTSASALDLGIWHRPDSSTPDQGSNSVFVAHRYLYTSGPNTFYHLNKINIDEVFSVYWEGEEYKYQVIDTREVEDTAIEIENPTNEAIITLYTCSGIRSDKRLVVIGKLIS